MSKGVYRKSHVPLVFEDAGRVFRPDACEPLKIAAKKGEIELAGWARGNYPGERINQTVLPGIRSIGYWDAHRRQGWGLGEHCNEGLEITYLSRGTLSFASPGSKKLLQSGDLTMTAPWLIHEVGLPDVEESRLIWIIIDVGVRRPNQCWNWPDWVLLGQEEKSQLSNIIQNSDRTVWPGRELAPRFEEIFDLLQTSHPDTGETDAKILINSILLGLVRILSSEHDLSETPRDKTSETVRLFLDRLDDHIDYPWRVQEMARQCGVSRGAFITICHDLLNQTPHAYLMRLRIRRACELLEDVAGKNLTQIALACGFSSGAHFSTAFKKEMGQTPSAFRDFAQIGKEAAE